MLAGIITYVALQTHSSCEKVFTETARQSSKVKAYEVVFLERLAEAACKTTYPEIIWQIAKQESGFRFLIVRLNHKTNPVIIEHPEDVKKYLTKLKAGKAPNNNVDIGPMQVNFKMHGENFNNDPFSVLDPSHQVFYLASSFGKELVDRCKGDWVGCYHNNDKDLRNKYMKGINDQGYSLVKASFTYLQNNSKNQKSVNLATNILASLKKKQTELKVSKSQSSKKQLVASYTPSDDKFKKNVDFSSIKSKK